MKKLPLIIAAISTFSAIGAFAEDAAQQPAVNLTGITVSCMTRGDLDREVYQLVDFQVEALGAQDDAAPVESTKIRLSFDAQFYKCSTDANSKSGFQFLQEDDAIHGLGQTWKHDFVLGNYRIDKKDERVMSGFGIGADFKLTATSQLFGGVSFTHETIDMTVKKLLDKKELTALKSLGKLTKTLVVYQSFDGYNDNSGGGYRIDFTLTMSADYKVQIDSQTPDVLQLR